SDQDDVAGEAGLEADVGDVPQALAGFAEELDVRLVDHAPAVRVVALQPGAVEADARAGAAGLFGVLDPTVQLDLAREVAADDRPERVAQALVIARDPVLGVGIALAPAEARVGHVLQVLRRDGPAADADDVRADAELVGAPRRRQRLGLALLRVRLRAGV